MCEEGDEENGKKKNNDGEPLIETEEHSDT